MNYSTARNWTLAAVLTLALAWAITETEARPGQRGGNFVEEHDADGDGVVAQVEFRGPEEHFSHFDQNGDGVIEESEAPTGPPPGRDGEERQGSRRVSQERPGGGEGEQGPRMGFVERLDMDGDGGVSADEFDGPAEHFSHFDANEDGVITNDEAPQGPPPGARMREGRERR